MPTLFGTDGIRGKANVYPLDADTVLRVGMGLTHHLKNGDPSLKPRIGLGRDTRVSGPLLAQAFAAGVAAAGGVAVDFGVVSTPAVAFLTRKAGLHAGIVISASHNPYEDNGIKIFDGQGFKLPDEAETRISDLIGQERRHEWAVEPAELGRWEAYLGGNPDLSLVPSRSHATAAEEEYIAELIGGVAHGLRLDGMKIVLDAAHGAAFRLAPRLFGALGADMVVMGDDPDGRNINADCGSQHPQRVRAAVLQHDAAMGVSLDGDADRLIAIDERGEVVDGDAILAIVADHDQRSGELKGDAVVATVMSNLGLEEFLSARGLRLERTPVGDRYVVERMRRVGANLGGEQSGHLLFLDHTTTGDGVLAALKLLVVMKQSGKRLSELAAGFRPYPQTLLNIKVKEKRPLEELYATQALIEEIKAEMCGQGRILVRWSGTEPKARIMVEGRDATAIQGYAQRIAERLAAELEGR